MLLVLLVGTASQALKSACVTLPSAAGKSALMVPDASVPKLLFASVTGCAVNQALNWDCEIYEINLIEWLVSVTMAFKVAALMSATVFDQRALTEAGCAVAQAFQQLAVTAVMELLPNWDNESSDNEENEVAFAASQLSKCD